VDYCDPHFPVAHHTRKHDLGLKSVPCTAEVFARYDAVVVSTAHDIFANPALYAGVTLVVDTRTIIGPLFAGRASTVRGIKA
jgi:UDP-N-acetyl-D-glucosamine dehydrogenase